MIFHTAAEIKYFDYFFENWHQTIKKVWGDDVKFSLRFVGPMEDRVATYCETHSIAVTHDPTVGVDPGYYPMSRWVSIPTGDHVCVTDVDIVALTKVRDIEHKLAEYDMIPISRVKVTMNNPMMAVFYNKNFAKRVRNEAIRIFKTKALKWDLDVSVMKWCKGNLTWMELFEIQKLDNTILGGVPVNDSMSFGYCGSTDYIGEDLITYSGVEAKHMRYKELFLKMGEK